MDYRNKARMTIMCCSSLFEVTGKKLVALSFLFLSVALYATSTYFFSMDTILSPFSSNYSAQPSNTPGEIDRNKTLHITHNSSHIDSKLTSNNPLPMDKIINSDNFQYIIRPRVTCSGREVDLAICVAISHDNHEGRSVIRKTWGSYAKDPNNKAVLVFFVGTENEQSETENRLVRQSRLQEEASAFGDIVQENYIDNYKNLTLKSVSFLRWVNSFCPKSKYILKVDDDVYVNIPLLMKVLQNFLLQSSPPSEFIIGFMVQRGPVDRAPTSKWYVPYSQYSEQTFPKYVSGPAYVVTSKAALLIYEASLRVARIWVEDVYITGMCSKKAGVRVYHSSYFKSHTPVASGCSFRTVVSGHKYTQDEIVKIHTELNDPNLKC